MKEWVEVAVIVACFVVFCIVTCHLVMGFIVQLGETIPAPPW